jgi:hypothetical protein
MIYFFKKTEFVRGRNWYELCDVRLLILLDTFRLQWGAPVDISPHIKAIGREDGSSQHNYKRWGKVKAIDIMPRGILDDPDTAIDIANAIGFTGIGYYPHWFIGDNVRGGLHLDVRQGDPMNPATWGGVRTKKGQVYVSLEEALNA